MKPTRASHTDPADLLTCLWQSDAGSLRSKNLFVSPWSASRHTFSGAEEFAYDLKNLKRITVVGESTRGGAHAVSGQPAGEHFIIYVPHARGIAIAHPN